MKVQTARLVALPVVLVSALAVTTSIEIIAAAPQVQAFYTPPSRDFVVPQFADREIAELLNTLDAMLLQQPQMPDVEDAGRTLWNFVRRLQAGRMTGSQESTVLSRLRAIGRANDAYRDLVARPSYMVRNLTIGKTAPETAGRDLDGRPIKLSDYRGKVVVLTFSAEWCGICRSQYPYFRLMQDLYRNWPFAMLSVETGSTREAAKRAKADQKLTYRSFWDPSGSETGGAIATAWNVRGWPTLYVIDGDGVIRFVDLREEDLLKAVRQVVNEQVDRAAGQPAGKK